MKIELQFDSEQVLEVRLKGIEGIVRTGTVSDKPAVTRESAVSDAEKTVRKRRKRVARQAKAPALHHAITADTEPVRQDTENPVETVQQIAPTPEAQPEKRPEISIDELPDELANLPEKHKEFYWRKLEEYCEIYKPEKARSEALEMVRRVAGVG